MESNPPLTHWDSGLMALNPAKIESTLGTIIRTIYDDKKGLLAVGVKSEGRLEQTITITYNYFDEDNLEKEQAQKLPDAVQKLYTDFEIENASQLVGKKITGIYDFNILVGIRKVQP